MTVTIAIDTIGRDSVPATIVKGTALSIRKNINTKIIFFGDEKQIIPLIRKEPTSQSKSGLIHTSEITTTDMKPSLALKASKRFDMRLAIESVKKGKANTVAFTGNTGNYIALYKIYLHMLQNITKSAIASIYLHCLVTLLCLI